MWRKGSEVGRACEFEEEKLEKVVQEKREQWTGEMNPTEVGMDAGSDMNVTFAEINDEINNENVNDSGSEDVEDY